MIVFRVGKSRRGLERTERLDVVPRHNVTPTTANWDGGPHCGTSDDIKDIGARWDTKTANMSHSDWDCGRWEVVTNYWKLNLTSGRTGSLTAYL